ncbi:MAG: SMP-30/gluconolactonase/LRE family protein [Thermodesulfobacteriota bacterium]
MSRRKLVLLVVLILVLALGGFAVKTYYQAGELKDLKPYSRWDCRKTTGLPGSEDITIDPRTGLAFISAADFRARNLEGKYPRGDVYGYDLAAAEPALVNLTASFERPFFPHGLGLYQAPDGGATLFVVNHQPEASYVEIFDLAGGRLAHRRTVSGPLLHSPNDVIPVGPDRFYVTNDHGSTSKPGRTLEEYLQLARAQVLYFDGQNFSLVAGGLAYANGVNLSPDGGRLYVAETVGRRLRVYDRDQASGGLKPAGVHDLDTGADNIEVDAAGRLWIGCHPKLLTFVGYSKDPAKHSPSQVVRAEVVPGHGFVAVTEYLNLGEEISGSSVGAAYGDFLLIGSVFDDCFLACRPRAGTD